MSQIENLCQSFPDIKNCNISRDNTIDLVESYLIDNKVVFVEGEDNVGKTTLLAKFAAKHSDKVVAYFLRPSSDFSSDVDIIGYELYTQIKYLTDKTIDAENTGYDFNKIKHAMYKLHRLANFERKQIYIILDGFCDDDALSYSLFKSLIENLPVGYEKFRFIISGNNASVLDSILSKIDVGVVTLGGFSEKEAIEYFDGYSLSEEDLEEILNITKKPGLLAGLRRIVENGGKLNYENIARGGDNGIFEAEWNQVNESDDVIIKSIAIVCFNKGKTSVSEISQILNVGIDEIIKILNSLTFFTLSDKEIISFRSDIFRKFVQSRLDFIKNETYELIIDNLMAGPLSSSSISLVPALLKETGDYDRLLSFLSTEGFHKVVESCQSLYLLQSAADFGVEAAYKRKSDKDLMRLGLQRSIMTDLDQGEIVRSEVEAKLALGDDATAITIAHSCPTREERLHSLALIVRAKQEQSLSVDDEISEEINQLCAQIEPQSLGEKAFEIAETLSLSHPGLAVDLIERAKTDEEGEEELDMTLVKLSFSTLGFDNQKDSGGEAFNTVRSKIKNPRVKKFISSLAVLLDEYDSFKILEEVEKFDDVNEKLIFLKEWLKANKSKEGAGDVIESALNLIISTTEYSPTAKDYREIATPLPCLSNSEKRKSLTAKIIEQKNIIEKLGPTEEIIHLDLTVAHSRFIENVNLGSEDYIEIFLRICEIEDIIAKAVSLSYFIVGIKNVDKEKILEENESLHSLSEKEFDECFERILNTTAQHYDAVADIIKPFSRHYPTKAVQVAERLNVSGSRDRAYRDIVKFGTDKAADNICFDTLMTIVARINNYSVRDRAIVHFVENMKASDIDEENIEKSLALFALVTKISDLEERCRTSCSSINFLKKYNSVKIEKIISLLTLTIESSFEEIDIKWVKVNVGLKLAKHMSTHSIELAKNYYEKIEEIRKDSFIDSYSYALNYISCVYLAIRAFSGLLTRNYYKENDLKKLFLLIDDIPSYIERSKLYAVLALNLYLYKKHEMFKETVADHLNKCLSSVHECGGKDELICIVSPVLFLFHRITAYTHIDKLPLPQRDAAIFNIIDFIFKKTPPNDPFESHRGNKYKITWEEILDVCELLERFDSDAAIYYVIERLSDSTTGKYLNSLSAQQRTALVQKLNKIVDDLLPRQNHIKHNGFVLISQARILKIKHNISPNEWGNLVDDARKIPNLADKIFILGIISATMTSKERKGFDGLIDETISLIEQMPSPLDKVNRYESIADLLKEIDPATSRECLKRAMNVTRGSDSPNLMSARRNLVDLAYRIDPDNAAELTTMFDDDPARIKSKEDLGKHYRFLENKKKMAASLESIDKMTGDFVDDLPAVCWRSLGSINAGRYSSLHVDNVRKIIELASKRPMSEAFPMLSFGIQNLNKRYQNTDQALTVIRPLFEAVTVSADLAKSMARRNSSFIDIAKNDCDSPYGDELLIMPGDRDKAIEYIMNIIKGSDSKYVKICDNFFGKQDLEWVKYISEANPKARIHVLTSKKQQKKDGITGDFQDAYSTHWRLNVSDQPPPYTDITVVGTASKEDLPIHDRWILLEDCGIRIGTSLKSIGITKDAELSLLTPQARSEFETDVDSFFDRSARERNGERVSIFTFSL